MLRVFIVLCLLSNSYSAISQVCKQESIRATTPNSRFIINSSETVTDIQTGLMWKRCLEGLSGIACDIGTKQRLSWGDTLNYVEYLNSTGGFAGYTDWKVPNVKELRSIVEEQCNEPAINLVLFPGFSGPFVWTSTPSTSSSAIFSYIVYFNNGQSYGHAHGATLDLLMVRNINNPE